MKDIFSKIGDFLGGLTTILLSFVSLSILAEVIFGLGIFGTSVVTNVKLSYLFPYKNKLS